MILSICSLEIFPYKVKEAPREWYPDNQWLEQSLEVQSILIERVKVYICYTIVADFQVPSWFPDFQYVRKVWPRTESLTSIFDHFFLVLSSFWSIKVVYFPWNFVILYILYFYIELWKNWIVWKQNEQTKTDQMMKISLEFYVILWVHCYKQSISWLH